MKDAFMNGQFSKLAAIAFFIALTPLVVHPQDAGAWRNITEISCNELYKCLTPQEMQSLVGKTLKHRSGRFRQSGFVYITLKPDGKIEGKQNQKTSTGTWTIKENTILGHTDNMGGDFAYVLLHIDSQLFAWVNRHRDGATLVPLAVVP